VRDAAVTRRAGAITASLITASLITASLITARAIAMSDRTRRRAVRRDSDDEIGHRYLVMNFTFANVKIWSWVHVCEHENLVTNLKFADVISNSGRQTGQTEPARGDERPISG
jgi:hypothetical protein